MGFVCGREMIDLFIDMIGYLDVVCGCSAVPLLSQRKDGTESLSAACRVRFKSLLAS